MRLLSRSNLQFLIILPAGIWVVYFSGIYQMFSSSISPAIDSVCGRYLWGPDVREHGAELGSGWAITPELHAYVEDLRNKANISGISVGVVRLQDSRPPEVDHASWGIRTEDREAVTTDVSAIFFIVAGVDTHVGDVRLCLELPHVPRCSLPRVLASSLTILPQGRTAHHSLLVCVLSRGTLRFLLYSRERNGVSRIPGRWNRRAYVMRFRTCPVWASTCLVPELCSWKQCSYCCHSHDLSVRPDDDALDAVRRMRFLKPAHEFRKAWLYNNLVRCFHPPSHLRCSYCPISCRCILSSHTLSRPMPRSLSRPSSPSASCYH